MLERRAQDDSAKGSAALRRDKSVRATKRVTIIDGSTNGTVFSETTDHPPQNDTRADHLLVLDVENARTANITAIDHIDTSTSTPNPLQSINELDIEDSFIEAALRWAARKPLKEESTHPHDDLGRRSPTMFMNTMSEREDCLVGANSSEKLMSHIPSGSSIARLCSEKLFSDPDLRIHTSMLCTPKRRPPLFSFSFRFINYNMANNDLALDNVGLGFVLRRGRQSPTTPSSVNPSPTPMSPPSPAMSSHASSSSVRSDQEIPPCRVSLSSLMRFGVQYPPKEARNSKVTPSKPKLRGFLRAFTASLKRSNTLRTTNGTTSTARNTTRTTARTTQDESGDTGLSPVTNLDSANTETTTPLGSINSIASNWLGATTVDCVFGCLCESQFHIEDYAKSHGLSTNFSSVSALQMLSELGAIEGMKGKAVGKLSGDLKAFMLCSDNFEEDDEKIFCSYDNASQGVSKGNPVKSFLGKTFTVASATLHVTCLGTHFPMQKVSSLMEDTSISEDEALQKVKCLFARCLQKILRHLLLEDVIKERSVIILQGDLNSRCLKSEGIFVDALWETLQDTKLQEFISFDLPPALRGEWREVVDCVDPGDLPVTYRFEQNKPPFTDAFRFPLGELYNFSAKNDTNYQQLLEQLQARGTLDEWGLYGSKFDVEHSKFKPSRLPACTERILYYAPAKLQECCEWETSWGYEVNYAWTGSDHKPVVLETTLKIHSPDQKAIASVVPGSSRPGSFRPKGKVSGVPDNFQTTLMKEDLCVNDPEDSDEEKVMPRSRTGMRISLNGPMEGGLLWK